MSSMKLLTEAHANAKTAKNESMGNYQSYILHLAPSRLSGHNVCPMASRGCIASCLNTAGRGRFDNVKTARLNKTKRFFDDRLGFMSDLVKDLNAVMRKSIRDKMRPVVRLNGTSDLDWVHILTDNGQNVFERFPKIQFYDYTKVLRRLKQQLANPVANYDLTFSKSETNDSDVQQALALGFNVAAVFNIKDASQLPKKFQNIRIIDGDSHDLRFLDKKSKAGQSGLYVGLKAKGPAKRDLSGFVVQLDVKNKAA